MILNGVLPLFLNLEQENAEGNMNDAILIIEDNFQLVWKKVLLLLKENHWDLYNVMVQFPSSINCENELNKKYTSFTKAIGILKPKSVVYTIFPYKLYRRNRNIDTLSDKYIHKEIPHLKRMPKYGWGTYFLRMVDYNGDGNSNQLKRIIDAINERDRTTRAGYTIVIEKPGGETVKPLGAPCLNYIAIQLEKIKGVRDRISLLAVYRNHDFLERAYGNYLGLSHLLKFIADQTDLEVGKITCVSSHAFVDKKKSDLKDFIEENF